MISIRLWCGALLGLVLAACGDDGFSRTGDGPGGAVAAADGGEGSSTATGGAAGSGGQPSMPLCVPGKSEPCAGPAGCMGGQICASDGSGFGECACAPTGTGGGGDAGATGIAGAPPKMISVNGTDWICGVQLRTDTEGQHGTCSCYRGGAIPEGFCEKSDCTVGGCPLLISACCATLNAGALCYCASDTSPCDNPAKVPSCP
jgi:hypothetical protein